MLSENVQLWSAIASQLEIDKSQPLGKGSFGEVYYGTYYKAPVAIKTLKSAHLTDKGMKDFANEVKTLAYVLIDISLILPAQSNINILSRVMDTR